MLARCAPQHNLNMFQVGATRRLGNGLLSGAYLLTRTCLSGCRDGVCLQAHERSGARWWCWLSMHLHHAG